MKTILSYNVNGLRAALGKGFAEWLKTENPDIICIQETKAQPEQIDEQIFRALGYQCYWFSAIKKGYSGTAIFTKIKPDFISQGIGIDLHDSEGRVLRADFGELTLLCAYFPSGSTGDERQDVKMTFLADIQNFVNNLKTTRPNIVLSGDFNICHKAIDIHNPERNKKTSGFLPEERAWVDAFVESGFVDSFRVVHTEPHRYSWWTYRAGAREKNLGWRIDYHMVSKPLVNKIIDADIFPNIFHSDHCPIMVKIDF